MRRLFGDTVFLRLHMAISIILFIFLILFVNTGNKGGINFVFTTASICVLDLLLEGKDTDEDNDEDSKVS
nr:MAG TPA: hypothetical protein [Caudoviricetes sp.]